MNSLHPVMQTALRPFAAALPDTYPCPFCGSSHARVKVLKDEFGNPISSHIECANCGAAGPSVENKNTSDAIARWNSREP